MNTRKFTTTSIQHAEVNLTDAKLTLKEDILKEGATAENLLKLVDKATELGQATKESKGDSADKQG